MNRTFSRLSIRNGLAKTAGVFVGSLLACVGMCSGNSIQSARTNLQAALHSRPAPGSHHLFESSQITNAIQAFGTNRAAAFPVLREASDETNDFLVLQNGQSFDTNSFVRAGALYGMGQLGRSVPEVTPFLWGVIHSPSRSSLAQVTAFNALKNIGFQVRDIPALAKLLSSSTCNNILTMLVPETISGLIGKNPSAARPYLPSVENLLTNSNPDTQFRAALALVKFEGADSPRIFSALHALFQRPNGHNSEYYKMLAAQVLAQAGPSAKPLVPDLLQFAKLPDEGGIYQDIAQIAPELGSRIPEVAQVLEEQQRERMWEKKWKSGSYTLKDLRAALKDPKQALTAAKLLAEKGAAAKAAVPDMIRAMWGKDEDTRNAILADVHKIDPQLTVTKIELYKGLQGELVDRGIQFAYSALQKMPQSPQIKTLKKTCFQMFFGNGGWVLPDELAALTNSLAARAPKAYQAYLDGLKPPVCLKPAGPNAVMSVPGVQLINKIK